MFKFREVAKNVCKSIHLWPQRMNELIQELHSTRILKRPIVSVTEPVYKILESRWTKKAACSVDVVSKTGDMKHENVLLRKWQFDCDCGVLQH